MSLLFCMRVMSGVFNGIRNRYLIYAELQRSGGRIFGHLINSCGSIACDQIVCCGVKWQQSDVGIFL